MSSPTPLWRAASVAVVGGGIAAPAIARWLVAGDTAELARLSPDRFAGRA